jgi:hypothetical protein
MYITNVVLTGIEQFFKFPLVFHHKSFVDQFGVDLESAVELNLDR